VMPQQRYSDYLFPLDDLPGSREPRRTRSFAPLLPEDSSAPTYAGKTFGVDLAFLVETSAHVRVRSWCRAWIPR